MSEVPQDGQPGLEFTSEHLGVRVWLVQAATQQDLIDRVAVVLGEHMADDELHITYAVIQNGSQEHFRPRLMREPDLWTERSRAPDHPGGAGLTARSGLGSWDPSCQLLYVEDSDDVRQPPRHRA